MSYGGFFAQYFDPKHINSEKFKFFKKIKKKKWVKITQNIPPK